MAGLYLQWRVVVNAQDSLDVCKESLFGNLLSADSHGVGGYFCRPPVNDIVSLVVTWCLYLFVVGNGDYHDEMIELDIGVIVAVFIGFVPIIEELGKTGSPGLWENFAR